MPLNAMVPYVMLGVVLADQGAADVVVRVIAQSDHPSLGAVNASLGFPPTPAAQPPASLCPTVKR